MQAIALKLEHQAREDRLEKPQQQLAQIHQILDRLKVSIAQWPTEITHQPSVGYGEALEKMTGDSEFEA